MRIKTKIEVLKIGLSAGLVLLFFSPIIAAEILNQKQAYQDLTKSFTEPSGLWVQANEDFEEGKDAPKFWLTTYVSGPGDFSVLSDVYAVSDQETCAHVAHFIYYFDEREEKIQRSAMLGNGKQMSAPIEFLGEEGYVSIIKIETPNGEITMKDTARIIDENTREASAHFLNAETGEWDFSDTKYWYRAGADFLNPC